MSQVATEPGSTETGIAGSGSSEAAPTTAWPADAEADKVRRVLEDFITTWGGRDYDTTDAYREVRGAQFDAGLAWVYFPEGRGGLAVRHELQRNVEKGLRSAGIPGMHPAMFFIALAGPTILNHGTPELIDKTLRPMFTGEDLWCQLFSEPGAGSDLASLASRAVRDGDEWIVNGQKVWTTLAHIATKGMLVARHSPDEVKHRGLTYFMVDMTAPGVEVRPLRQITGEAEFNEVYLTDVRVPDADRIGGIGDGWRVALTTLMNERTAIGGGGSTAGARKKGLPTDGPIGELIHWYRMAPRGAVERDRAMQLYCDAETLRLTNLRAVGASKAGKQPGPEGSIAKLALSNLTKSLYPFCLDLAGAAGMVGFDYTFRRPEAAALEGALGTARHLFLRSRANSIEGGTSEIMKNILGERVLGLPGEPRVDKDLPWSAVPR
jgi:alkylation response protein AidB-like acyl-CoA dehydrogenase